MDLLERKIILATDGHYGIEVNYLKNVLVVPEYIVSMKRVVNAKINTQKAILPCIYAKRI